MITQTPSPHGDDRVQLFDDGRFFVECPADHADEAIAHHINTITQHFGDIYERQRGGDPNLVIAMFTGKLTAFSIGSPNDYPRGFGGDTWHVFFDDGRYEACVSLWCMGDVPLVWQDRIVKNARLGTGVKRR